MACFHKVRTWLHAMRIGFMSMNLSWNLELMPFFISINACSRPWTCTNCAWSYFECKFECSHKKHEIGVKIHEFCVLLGKISCVLSMNMPQNHDIILPAIHGGIMHSLHGIHLRHSGADPCRHCQVSCKWQNVPW